MAMLINPPLSYNFLITLVDSSSVLTTVVTSIQHVAVGGFSECSGLESSQKIEEYNEGGRNGAVLKFPGRVSWNNIVLKRGVTLSPDLWDWYYSFVEGRGRRRDGVIALQNDLHLPVQIWNFKRGLPAKWTGPSMNATQNSVAIESIEIAHEGLVRMLPPASGPLP
jgi:phage tail-like protein